MKGQARPFTASAAHNLYLLDVGRQDQVNSSIISAVSKMRCASSM